MTRAERAAHESGRLRDYAPFVRRLAQHYSSPTCRTLTCDDLTAAGMVGALTALRRFDPSAGAAFTTFAYFYTRAAIIQEIRSWRGRRIRPQFEPLERILTRDHYDEKSRPTRSELTVPDIASAALAVATVGEVLARLPERLRFVLRRRYLDGATLDEIGGELGVTPSRVCQLSRAALTTAQALATEPMTEARCD